MIRKCDVGTSISYNEMLYSIMKNKDSDFDPTQINHKIKKPVWNGEANEKEKGRSMISTNGGAQLTYFTKRKLVNNNQNYSSNKDLFDWEASTLKKIKSGEMDAPIRHKNKSIHTNIFESHVFDKPMRVKTAEMKDDRKRTVSFLNGTGNILTWQGENKGSFKTTQKVSSDLKRINPNKSSNSEQAEKKPVKLNRMLASSSENTLSNNHLR